MAVHDRVSAPLRFGPFEVFPDSGELRKNGTRLKLSGQAIQVLAQLLSRPGQVVPREEIQQKLWPGASFGDFEHGLNAAVNRLRDVLGDSATEPKYIETVPRRGYRFIGEIEEGIALIAPLNGTDVVSAGDQRVPALADVREQAPHKGRFSIAYFGGAMMIALVLTLGVLLHKRSPSPVTPRQHVLARLTFDEGLQLGATWSPDGRFIAYSSDRGGKFDVWVQQVSGGDPVQITEGSGTNWQPDWSPDGKYIAYRSESGGGLFLIPALGGHGLERRISSFGYYPRWSPDGSKILFGTHSTPLPVRNRFYVLGIDGSAPREVMAEFAANARPFSAAWLPDGQRISISVSAGPAPRFLTVPIVGGPGPSLEIAPEVVTQLSEVAGGGPGMFAISSPKFSWSPSGTAIYLDRAYQDAEDIWRMNVDLQRQRGTTIERLTTGPADVQLALAPDGTKLAFTAQTQNVRTWLFPFDATRGRITGSAQAVTSSGLQAWTPNLSADGEKLAFFSDRHGKFELREALLSEGREIPIAVTEDSYMRVSPQWSRDGTRLVYSRRKAFPTYEQGRAEIKLENDLMLWSSQNGAEEPLTGISQEYRVPYDWSPDNNLLLISQLSSDTGRYEVWQLPLAARPHAERAAQRVISDRAYDLFQPHFSPDGRWIVFEAISDGPSTGSTLYTMPAGGGSWTRLTDGRSWDDKPRWSPDGKMIYFVSEHNGFFNVWGIRFDLAKGKPVGDAFQVTTFERPALMIPQRIPWVEISVTQHRLALNLAQVSGNIWMLDNVDR